MTAKKYPYNTTHKVGKSKVTRVHVSDALYIEINQDAQPHVTIVECGKNNTTSTVNFVWEFLNIPLNKIMRNPFGIVDMHSSGIATINFSGGALIDGGLDKDDDRVSLGVLIKEHETLKELSKILKSIRS